MPLPVIAIITLIAIAVLAINLYLAYRKYLHLQDNVTIAQLQLVKQISYQKDLTKELTNLKEKFAHDILYDTLTDLPGRQVFEDRLVQTLNQSKRYQFNCAVGFLDLDGFKVINDALGYEIGDQLLKEVAVRLKNAVRQVDTISRFAGDEFLFIFSRLSKPETAAYVAQRILEAISQPFKINTHELFITASMGIATFPADGEQGKVLVNNAANALHQAKARGRNNYQFYREEMYILSQRELALSSRLQSNAIYNDLSIYYQPQVNVETKKLVAMQAILQWQHPDFGVIPLQELIRLAENSGKIIAIGEWQLRNAFSEFKKWREYDFRPNSIAVSVTSKQIENPHFAYKLSQILQEMQVEPACLILEISEIFLINKAETLEKAFHMLKHMGVQLAIKDFGAGYLSLQHLKRFPIDHLKIAPSLIQDITINKESEAIIKMIVALSKTLQINVIAEGVESQRQKQILKELGCLTMQGAVFSAPFKADEFTREKIAACLAV